MIWNEENEFLVKELEAVISKSNNSDICLHVFVPKDSTSIPRDYPWIIKHESLTSEEDAAKIGLIVHVLQKHGSSMGRNNGRRRTLKRGTMYIVQNRNEDFGELIGGLQNSKGGSTVKVILLNSFDLPAVSPENERCALCNAITNGEIEEQLENTSRARRNDDSETAKSPDSKRGSQNELTSCLLCGKQRRYPREEMNAKFSRYLNMKDDQKQYSPRHYLQDSSSSDHDIFIDHDVTECRNCRDKRPSLNQLRYAHNGIKNNEERSKSSEEYNNRVNCHCSAEGMHICLSCLLAKLARPPLELKLGRSESAPGIFFHGAFGGRERGRDLEAPIEAETLEKGTSTENDLDMVVRVKSIDKSTEVKILTVEKSTNTPVERSTNTMREKSTSTDDLEEKIVDKVVETSLDETAKDTQDELPFDVKKSFFYYCTFCPEKTYRSKRLLSVHMKNSHKKCNCPCQQYFRTREDYLAHFYTVYPLPCMVEKKCPERFRNLYYQSLHHKDSHYSLRPFFCIPCYRLQEDRRLTKASFTFENIASLRIHASTHGHDPKEMYLVTVNDTPDDSKLPFSMRCSGINYC